MSDGDFKDDCCPRLSLREDSGSFQAAGQQSKFWEMSLEDHQNEGMAFNQERV